MAADGQRRWHANGREPLESHWRDQEQVLESEFARRESLYPPDLLVPWQAPTSDQADPSWQNGQLVTPAEFYRRRSRYVDFDTADRPRR